MIQNEIDPADSIIQRLVNQQMKATPAELGQIIDHVSAAPFAEALLEANESLWGSFWHFDVISPGYRLPAVELALLRAIRLDQTWPENSSVEQFLADLRGVIENPKAGVWTLPVAGEPCVGFAAVNEQTGLSPIARRPPLWTVVLYCATTGRLHAGYRTARTDCSGLPGVITHRKLPLSSKIGSVEESNIGWLADVVANENEETASSFVARLDIEILRLRLRMGTA